MQPVKQGTEIKDSDASVLEVITEKNAIWVCR